MSSSHAVRYIGPRLRVESLRWFSSAGYIALAVAAWVVKGSVVSTDPTVLWVLTVLAIVTGLECLVAAFASWRGNLRLRSVQGVGPFLLFALLLTAARIAAS